MGLNMSGDIADFVSDLEAEADDIVEAADKAIGRITHEIANEAQRRTPKDTHFLEGSRRVEKVDQMHWRILFWANYAVYVHEREELHHDNGESKFLTKAIDNARPAFEDDLRNYTNRYL